MSDWFASWLDPESASFTAAGVYAFVWTLVFLETAILVLFWLPGDTILFTAGLIAGVPASGVDIRVLATGTVIAAIAGDTLAYATGRRLGRPWLERRPEKILRYLKRAESLYDRFGVGAVVVCRFIPWARVFVPVLAGVAKMPYKRFLAANVVGALVWGAGLTTIGWAAAQLPVVKNIAYVVAAVAVVSSFLVPALMRVHTTRKARAERARTAGAAEPTEEPAPTDAPAPEG